MEPEKWPETELEYFMTIEALGGFIWRTEHDLADGRILDPDNKISEEIQKERGLSEKLVGELTEKFNVVHPKDSQTGFGKPPLPAPAGKIYYWDWYRKMKDEWLTAEFEKTICSACPYCEGLGKFIASGGTVYCNLKGFLSTRGEGTCFYIYFEKSTDKEIEELIAKKGKDALALYLAKKEVLLRQTQTI